MAITVGTVSGNWINTGSSVQLQSMNITSSHGMVAIVMSYSNTGTPSVSDSINGSWGTAVATYQNTGVMTGQIAVFVKPLTSAGGQCTITASFGATAGGELHWGSFSGLATSNVFDQSVSGSGSATAASIGPVTPTLDGSLLVGYCAAFTSSVKGSAWTAMATEDSNSSEYLIQTTASSISPSWTANGGGWIALTAVLKAQGATGGGGGSSVVGRLMMLGCGG
jgi:hypothetical protein